MNQTRQALLMLVILLLIVFAACADGFLGTAS